MTECQGDCATFSAANKASWFKIHEGGMLEGPVRWATSKLIRANNSLTVTIPSSLKAGNYLIRHELIVSLLY
jgi:Auxiliary Activity family 9 (formerly GH61)